MKVQNINIDILKPFEKNPKSHPAEQINRIVRSIQEFGFTNPILALKENNMIIAGHARLKAAQQMNLVQVPVIFLDMPYEKAIAYVVADNRLAELAKWDEQMLLPLLDEVKLSGIDIELTGFTSADISLMNKHEVQEDDFDAGAAADAIKEPITQVGDIWILGKHRLLCGDSGKKEDVLKLMAGRNANLCITSPPYAQQRKEDYGGIAPDKYIEWFDGVARNIKNILSESGSFFLNIKEHSVKGERDLYVHKLIIYLKEVIGFKYIDELIWKKPAFPMKGRNKLKNAFEPIFHLSKEGIEFTVFSGDVNEDLIPLIENPYFNSYENVFHFGGQTKIYFNPKQEGRTSNNTFGYTKGQKFQLTSDLKARRMNPMVALPGNRKGIALPSNVIDIGCQSPLNKSMEKLPPRNTKGIALPSNVLEFGVNTYKSVHSAMYPIKLPAFFMKVYSEENAIVYEPFSGGGTTLMAGEQLNRSVYAMEVLPKYADVCVQRWELFTGKKAHKQEVSP